MGIMKHIWEFVVLFIFCIYEIGSEKKDGVIN